MKTEREVDESFSLHTKGESFGNRRIDLNDLLRRAKEEKRINNKNNFYISAGIVTVFAIVLLIVNL